MGLLSEGQWELWSKKPRVQILTPASYHLCGLVQTNPSPSLASASVRWGNNRPCPLKGTWLAPLLAALVTLLLLLSREDPSVSSLLSQSLFTLYPGKLGFGSSPPSVSAASPPALLSLWCCRGLHSLLRPWHPLLQGISCICPASQRQRLDLPNSLLLGGFRLRGGRECRV